MQVGNFGACRLGEWLRVEGVVGLPSQGLQLDPQQVGQELGRLGVAPTPTVLDPEDVVATQVGPPGELRLAYPPAQAPVLEPGERKPPAPDRGFRLTDRHTHTRDFLSIPSHASNLPRR